MLRTTILSITAFSVAMLGLAATNTRGAEPFQGIVDTARGLFGVDVDVNNGVRVRAGLIDIHVNDNGVGRAGRRGPAWMFRGQYLIGTPVMDRQHQEVGVVNDAVIDLRSGKVRYMAIEYPSLYGRDKLFAVPWDRFQLARNENGGYYLVVNIEEELFEHAPGFAKTTWPNFADRRWAESVDIYYGVHVKPGDVGDVKTRFGTQPDPVRKVEHLERLSQVRGFPVTGDKSEQQIGSVADVIVDFSTGHVRYAVLHFPDSIGIAERRFAVPFEKFDYETETDNASLELEVDRSTLARAPSFEDSRWPDLRHPDFAAQVDGYYGIERR